MTGAGKRSYWLKILETWAERGEEQRNRSDRLGTRSREDWLTAVVVYERCHKN